MKCYECELDKPESEFGIDLGDRRSKSAKCKECRKHSGIASRANAHRGRISCIKCGCRKDVEDYVDTENPKTCSNCLGIKKRNGNPYTYSQLEGFTKKYKIAWAKYHYYYAPWLKGHKLDILTIGRVTWDELNDNEEETTLLSKKEFPRSIGYRMGEDESRASTRLSSSLPKQARATEISQRLFAPILLRTFKGQPFVQNITQRETQTMVIKPF